MYYIPYLLDVNIYLEANINDVLFTGKLVKSLLIDANSRLKEIFTKTRGVQPKLVHITPLYQVSNGKTKCLYSYATVDTVESRVVRIHETIIRNGVYKFYIGFIEDKVNDAVSFDIIYNTLLNISGVHRFKKYRVKVELASVDIVDVYAYAENIVQELLRNKKKLKVVFSSPTLLRDPLRASKQKSLIPSPINIFSTPTYINLYLSGKLRRRNMMRTLVLLHRLLNEPYSIFNTVNIKWIIYDEDKQPIPTLTGYINLYLNRTYYEEYNRKYNLEELLQKTFTTILTLGTGTSRATGFGHITIQPKQHHDGRLLMISNGASADLNRKLINKSYKLMTRSN